MAKTEVILIKPVVGLGGESDTVTVTAGYARNYLVPNGIAIPVSAGNKRRLEKLQKVRADREAHELNSMAELGKSLNKVTLTLMVKTGDDGKMFGSVTSGTIADAIKTQLDVVLDKRKIHLEKAIHTVGEFEIELRLHPEVKSVLKIIVKSSNPLPAPVVDDKAEAPRTEKRGRREAPAAEATAPTPEAEAKPAKGGKGAKNK
ncbi:MAG TPA: 50S ribosomal protein L9 [Candidatus Limnocylindria bacterium]|jgi:large subunit ribosomal protein L9|nr:50S ribosomal protein L9 [Candidatus Limnocylindria bacterium]